MPSARPAALYCLFVLTSFAFAACVIGPNPAPSAPPVGTLPLATAAPPTAVALPSATALPPPVAPSPTLPATTVPAASPRFAVQQGSEVVLVAPDGQTQPLAEAPSTFYVLADLTGDASAPRRVYALGPNGAQPLDFIQDISQGFAAWTDPVSGEARLAWDTYSAGAATGALLSQILLSDPSGLQARVLVEEAGGDRVLRVAGWSADGQRLFFSKEPLGLGGYILFGGISNLWVYDWATGATTPVVPEAAAGALCLDDFTESVGLVALHCANGQLSLLDLSLGQIIAVRPPPEVAGEVGVMGGARFSPAEDQLAFSLARGDPEAEQGWVAVSDGLPGPARLVATADPGDTFDVRAWLDEDTLLLQSWAGTPGVWTVNTDGSALQRVVDGTFLAAVW